MFCEQTFAQLRTGFRLASGQPRLNPHASALVQIASNVAVHTLFVTLFLVINETLKWLLLLPILMQQLF